MKKFILEIENDKIEKFGLEKILEDYFYNLWMDNEIEVLPSYKLEEVE